FEGGEIRSSGELSEESLVEEASELGMDPEQFRADMNSEQVQEIVDTNAQQGIDLGAMSTPAFVIGGTPTVGAQPTEVFTDMVDEALAEARGRHGSRTAHCFSRRRARPAESLRSPSAAGLLRLDRDQSRPAPAARDRVLRGTGGHSGAPRRRRGSAGRDVRRAPFPADHRDLDRADRARSSPRAGTGFRPEPPAARPRPGPASLVAGCRPTAHLSARRGRWRGRVLRRPHPGSRADPGHGAGEHDPRRDPAGGLRRRDGGAHDGVGGSVGEDGPAGPFAPARPGVHGAGTQPAHHHGRHRRWDHRGGHRGLVHHRTGDHALPGPHQRAGQLAGEQCRASEPRRAGGGDRPPRGARAGLVVAQPAPPPQAQSALPRSAHHEGRAMRRRTFALSLPLGLAMLSACGPETTEEDPAALPDPPSDLEPEPVPNGEKAESVDLSTVSLPLEMTTMIVVDPGWTSTPLERDGMFLAYDDTGDRLRFVAADQDGTVLWEAERPL